MLSNFKKLKIIMIYLVRNIAKLFGILIIRDTPFNTLEKQLSIVFKLLKIDVVFDIGANEGQFAREIRQHGYRGNIISFEPLTSARKSLLSFASRDLDWQVHKQSVIGDRDGEIEINIAGNSVSSSVLPMLESHSSAAVGSAYVGSERVPIFKLDSIANRYLEKNSNLFIKIDTQGYEWQVLDGARETLKRAQGVLCELSLVPLYHEQRLWRDIVDRLDQQGFMLWALQKGFANPKTGQSLQMDGIFIRKTELKKIY
jgi:FkbM family methyltransferase